MSMNMDNARDKKKMWAEEVLESLEGIQRAPANPFLYTRILARMQPENSVWERIAAFVARPAFAVGAIALFLSINIWVALQQMDGSDTRQNQESEHLFASEYSPVNYTLIDLAYDK